MEKELKILVVENNIFDAGLMERELNKAQIKYNMELVDTKPEILQKLYNYKPDFILCDHSLSSINSMDVFKLVKEICPEIPFILVTGALSEENAINYLSAGMDDYVLKNNLVRLPSSIKAVLYKKEIQHQKKISESLNKKLVNAFEKIEEKNKEILDSITYAKKLQEAIMPKQEDVNRFINDCFIYHRPKDIVSGDFCFMEPVSSSTEKNLSAIAVADCTGHGVPGAFMSMLGYSILKNSVNEKNNNSTAKVLNSVNSCITKMLHSSSNSQQMRDGMDIAFCILNKDTLQLEYSGANNSCWIIKKNKTVIELKPTKQPIGFFENSKPFTSTTVQLGKGDMVYLFTDGYADQFGGPKGKKFMRQQLIKMLVSVSHEETVTQKNSIEKTFLDWKGNADQVDDVLMVGIKA